MSVLKFKNASGAWTAIEAIKGDKGDKGDKGNTGAAGANGVGVPSGGTQGQVLSKASGTDYDTEWVDQNDIPVEDVQINGTSIVSDGVANIPVAGENNYGAIKVKNTYGIGKSSNDELALYIAGDNEMKSGSGSYVYRPITASRLHTAVFYGLAKAAGDTTQSQSSNPVGTYTDNAKSAIKAMLDIGGETQTVQVTGATPVITANQNTRYVCGEVTSLDFTPSAYGICDVIFTSGSTVTVLTLPNTVKLPAWFDSTALETDTTYEISISDGVYGAVMSWQ